MTRKPNTLNLKEAIANYVEESGLEHKFDEASIVNIWSEVMGKSIVNRTKKIYLNQGVLHILVDSGPLRNKLFYEQDKVQSLINEKLGKGIVKKVVVR